MPLRSRLRLLALLLCVSTTSACRIFRVRPPKYEVVHYESGLVVRDRAVPVEGPTAALGDTVAINYEVRLEDGPMVDSSLQRGQPIRFQIGAHEVPAGLEEGVIGMRLFGRRGLAVPPHLGYGSEGMPPLIPSDATLRFEVELMEIEQASPQPGT